MDNEKVPTETPSGNWETYDYDAVFDAQYAAQSTSNEMTTDSDYSSSDSGGSTFDAPSDQGGGDNSGGSQSSWGLGAWASSAYESVTSYFSGSSTQAEATPTDEQTVDTSRDGGDSGESDGESDGDGEGPGMREQGIALTDEYEHGTIGHAFNATARGFLATVGENESDAPILEFLQDEHTQELMAEPMSNREAAYEFAQGEQDAWGQDTTGNLGASIGANMPPSVRVPAMDAVEYATQPVSHEDAVDSLLSHGS